MRPQDGGRCRPSVRCRVTLDDEVISEPAGGCVAVDVDEESHPVVRAVSLGYGHGLGCPHIEADGAAGTGDFGQYDVVAARIVRVTQACAPPAPVAPRRIARRVAERRLHLPPVIEPSVDGDRARDDVRYGTDSLVPADVRDELPVVGVAPFTLDRLAVAGELGVELIHKHPAGMLKPVPLPKTERPPFVPAYDEKKRGIGLQSIVPLLLEVETEVDCAGTRVIRAAVPASTANAPTAHTSDRPVGHAVLRHADGGHLDLPRLVGVKPLRVGVDPGPHAAFRPFQETGARDRPAKGKEGAHLAGLLSVAPCGVAVARMGEDKRLAFPFEPQRLVTSRFIDQFPDAPHRCGEGGITGRQDRRQRAEEGDSRHGGTAFFHREQRLAHRGDPFLVGMAVRDIEYQNIHARVGKHLRMAAADERVIGKVVPVKRFAPVMRRVPRAKSGGIRPVHRLRVGIEDPRQIERAIGEAVVVEKILMPGRIEHRHRPVRARRAGLIEKGEGTSEAIGGGPRVGHQVSRRGKRRHQGGEDDRRRTHSTSCGEKTPRR